MKNFTSILSAIIFILITAISANAAEVPSSKVETVAVNFFWERYGQYFDDNYTDLEITEHIPVYFEGKLVYHAFNFDQGFILVSGHDQVYPILGYSFTTKYQPSTIHESFSEWIAQYARQILFAVESNSPATKEISDTWEKYSDPNFDIEEKADFRDIEPMLTSTWDQGKYYNQMCPADPQGVAGHCVTGCVATALGQLAYYFRHPQTGIGSYSYNQPPYGTISADYGATTYKWDEMSNVLTESNLAVAELIFHIGVGCDMVYGPQSSGMYNHKAAHTMRSFFKYSPETEYVYRDSTSMDWDSLLVAHLDQKIPMYYAGWSVPNINGHAYIVDGYQGDHFYHFNWGWGGSYDGYFYTENLTPGGNNFNLAQELVVNCFPDTTNYTYPEHCAGDKTLTSMNGTIDDGSGPCYNYKTNAQCSWLIDPQTEVDSITSISLSFDRFNLIAGSDFLSVYDGADGNAPLIGNLTGENIPNEIISNGNKLFLTFTSEENNAAPGFFASYSTERPKWCSGMTVLTEQTDEISDGSYQFYYENNSLCMWQVIPPNASTLTLNFTKFQTEEDTDVLKIYDLSNNTLLAELSGIFDPPNLPLPVTSPSGKMFITFTTNGDTRFDGWEAWYETDLVDIEEISSELKFEVYPNPASEAINITINQDFSSSLSIELCNYQGQSVIYQTISKSGIKQLNVSSIPEGLYLLKIHNQEMSNISKIVISR
jgi:hypothetical protein